MDKNEIYMMINNAKYNVVWNPEKKCFVTEGLPVLTTILDRDYFIRLMIPHVITQIILLIIMYRLDSILEKLK